MSNKPHFSLAATIKAACPELLQSISVPPTQTIPSEMPANFLSPTEDHIEDIGQPVTPCFFSLSAVNPEKWLPTHPYDCVYTGNSYCCCRWIFEKYDGVRAFWNPKKKAFYSRHGKRFSSFPEEIIDSMPDDIFLDGELWYLSAATDLPTSLIIVYTTCSIIGLEETISWRRRRLQAGLTAL